MKILATGWQPKFDLETTIKTTAQWYIDNPWWLD